MYFNAVYSALMHAREEIYIMGWWICPQLYLRRPGKLVRPRPLFPFQHLLPSGAEPSDRVIAHCARSAHRLLRVFACGVWSREVRALRSAGLAI